MEVEQISKQVDWLDEQRRKDQNRIASLEEQSSGLGEQITQLAQQIRDLQADLNRLNLIQPRLDAYDETLQQLRLEQKQQYDSYDKGVKKREEDAEKLRRTEIRGLDTSLAELRKETEQIPELKRSLQARIEEDSRLSRQIDETRNRIETIRRSEEEYTRAIRLLDDGRRQDNKRLTELVGEVNAMRKRMEDDRSKLEMNINTIKKIDTRVNELSLVESERRQSISNFLENQALREVERERLWKDWQTRFQLIETQTSDVETALQTLDATHRAVKRSQQTLDEGTQKTERRINEITEIQRLAEERFRQEWVTFKADDQKRWTNYTLTLEEQRNETQRQNERLGEKVTHLEDTLQEIQDLVSQANEHTEKRLQTLLALVHEWVTSYERSISRPR
jgi:chromosome segregation ATPase